MQIFTEVIYVKKEKGLRIEGIGTGDNGTVDYAALCHAVFSSYRRCTHEKSLGRHQCEGKEVRALRAGE